MRKLILAALAPIALAGCTTLPPPPSAPVAVADQTVIDEQVGLTITLAYTAAAKAAALAIETGFVSDPATIRTIGVASDRAFAAVEAVEAAYSAGNAKTYAAALTDARLAVAGLLTIINGETT